MKAIKYLFIAIAAIIVLGIFALPYVDMGKLLKGMGEGGEALKFTMWKVGSESQNKTPIFLTIIAAFIPMVFGVLALSKTYIPRWQSAIALISFLVGALVVTLPFSDLNESAGAFKMMGEVGAIGSWLMLFAMLFGAVGSIASLVRPGQRN